MIFCKEAEEDEDREDVFRETKASRPGEDPAVLMVRPDNLTLSLSSFLELSVRQNQLQSAVRGFPLLHYGAHVLPQRSKR